MATMKKTRFEKELAQAGKELRLIDEGKLKPQPLAEVIEEMRKKHGGKRAGAGRKTSNPKVYTIRVSLEEKTMIDKMRQKAKASK